MDPHLHHAILTLYGIAFFLLGVVVWTKIGPYHDTVPARLYRCLAAFGLLHGGHELFGMLMSLPGAPAWTGQGALLLGALSYVPLLNFGLRMTVLPTEPRGLINWPMMLSWLAFTLWLLHNLHASLNLGGALVLTTPYRHLLALPAITLTVTGLLLYPGRITPHADIQRHLRLAGAGFLAYLFASGVEHHDGITPLLTAIHLHPPLSGELLRVACALWITFFIARSLDLFGLLEKQALHQHVTAKTRELQEANDQMRRANRSLRCLSRCHECLVQSRDEEELLAAICRVLVATGGYEQAWIGYHQELPEMPCSFRHIHQNSGEPVCRPSDPCPIALGDGCPVHVALDSRQPHLVRCVGVELHQCPWHDTAEATDTTLSLAVLPLIAAGDPMGVLNVLAQSPGFSDEEELAMLQEVANNLAIGITSLRNRRELQQAERALHEQAVYLDNILRSSLELSIAATDLNFRIRYYNPVAERLFGYKAEEVIGMTVMEVHTREKVSHERFERAIAIVRESGEYHYEVRQERAEGLRIVESRVSGIWDAERQLVGFVLISQDVSARRQAEEELRRHRDQLDGLVKERTTAMIQAYHALQERENALSKYESIVAASQDLLSLLDRAFIHQAVNATCLHYHGKERGQVVGHPMADLLGVEQFGRIRKKLEFCLAGHSVRFQDWIDFPALGRRWMNIAFEPYRGRDGAVEGVVLVAHDATDWRKAHLALVESEKRYFHLFDNMSSGVAVYEVLDAGADFLFKEFNKAAEHINHLRREEVIGHRLTEVFPGVAAMGLLAVLQRVWRTGEPERLPVTQYQDQRLSLWMENHLYRLSTGEVVAVHDDLTERMATEQRMRDLSSFPNQNPYVVMRVDQDGVILYANQGSQALREHWHREVGDRLNPEWREILATTLARGTLTQMEVTTGHPVYLVTLVPFADLGYVNLYGMEITRLKQVEAQLRLRQREIEQFNTRLEQRVLDEVEKNRRKDMVMMHQSRLAAMGEMMGNIAHQWRQPLNALGLILSNVVDRAEELAGGPDAELKVRKDKGTRILARMSATIDDFRHFFRPSKEKALFNLDVMTREAMALVEASFLHSQIFLDYQPPASPLYGLGYANEFSQVILILLTNAKDAILESKVTAGRVVVRLERAPGHAMAVIQDNGGGIPPEVRARIFDPYFTTKGERQGMGIGLYMARLIVVENMGGSIEVQDLEKGSEFRVIIPIAGE